MNATGLAGMAPVVCNECGGEGMLAPLHKTNCSRARGLDAAIEGALARGALAHQEGGGHYKDMKIQPVEFIHANGIGYFEGNVIKYVSRWRAKGGVEDLKKARHYIDLLIDLESKT